MALYKRDREITLLRMRRHPALPVGFTSTTQFIIDVVPFLLWLF